MSNFISQRHSNLSIQAKKAQKDAEANERIRCAEAENVFSDRRIEEGKFQKILASRNLKICQVGALDFYSGRVETFTLIFMSTFLLSDSVQR